MTKKELMRLSKDQLAKACRNQGLDSGGDKAAQVARLVVLEDVEPEVSAPAAFVPVDVD